MFTLVIPMFNEASRKSQLFWRDLVHLENVNFIFVDDFSSDDTIFEISKLPNIDRILLLRNSSNLGKAESIRRGVLEAYKDKNSFIGYVDADGSISISEIKRGLTVANQKFSNGEFNVIWFSRVKLKGRKIVRSKFRRITGYQIRTFLHLFLKGLPMETQTGFKLFRKSDISVIYWEKPFITKWFIDIEIFTRIRILKKISIWEEPLEAWQEKAKGSLRVSSIFLVFLDLSKLFWSILASWFPSLNWPRRRL
jgi:dolichyl-phosphate beta-glucosyltransferase